MGAEAVVVVVVVFVVVVAVVVVVELAAVVVQWCSGSGSSRGSCSSRGSARAARASSSSGAVRVHGIRRTKDGVPAKSHRHARSFCIVSFFSRLRSWVL